MVEHFDRGGFSYKKVRKHVSQMSSSEKKQVRKMFNDVKSYTITNHVNDRILEKGYKVTTDDIIDLMINGEIVEYEQKIVIASGELSHLLVLKNMRDNDGEKDIMHLVFDMTNKLILTIWTNHHTDLHDTLDMGIYSKGLKVGENYWQS